MNNYEHAPRPPTRSDFRRSKGSAFSYVWVPRRPFPFWFCIRNERTCILSHPQAELTPFLYQGIYVGNTIYYMLYIYISYYIYLVAYTTKKELKIRKKV